MECLDIFKDTNTVNSMILIIVIFMMTVCQRIAHPYLINLLLWYLILFRYHQTCEAHFDPDVDYPSSLVIRSSTIGLYVDATGMLYI